jgi:hypothetical protein
MHRTKDKAKPELSRLHRGPDDKIFPEKAFEVSEDCLEKLSLGLPRFTSSSISP